MTELNQSLPVPTPSLRPSELHRRLCHYVALPDVHERLAELAWADAFSRDRAERLGLTRSFGVQRCRHFKADPGQDLRCEQREEYLDENPKFLQSFAKLGGWPWPSGFDEELLSPLDVHLDGGWRYAYRRYWAHFERSRQSGGMGGWKPSLLVKDERSPEKPRVEDRLDFEVGVLVRTTTFSATELAGTFERFQLVRPDMRFALLTTIELDANDSMVLDRARVTLIHPGYGFDASAVTPDTAAPPAER